MTGLWCGVTGTAVFAELGFLLSRIICYAVCPYKKRCCPWGKYSTFAHGASLYFRPSSSASPKRGRSCATPTSRSPESPSCAASATPTTSRTASVRPWVSPHANGARKESDMALTNEDSRLLHHKCGRHRSAALPLFLGVRGEAIGRGGGGRGRRGRGPAPFRPWRRAVPGRSSSAISRRP